MVSWSDEFSRAGRLSQVFASSTDWFIACFAVVVVVVVFFSWLALGDNFGFLSTRWSGEERWSDTKQNKI